MISITDLQISHYSRYGSALPESGSIITTPEGEIPQGYLAFLRLGRGVEIRRTTRASDGNVVNVYILTYPDPKTH